jgi:hypothetical protein
VKDGASGFFAEVSDIVFDMNARNFLHLTFLLFAVTLQAQKPEQTQMPNSEQELPSTQPPVSTLPPDSTQPREMEDWLNSGDDKEKTDRLINLGIDKNAAKEIASDEIMDNVLWKNVRTGSRQNYAVLFFPCGFRGAYLYVLAQKDKSWHISSEDSFDCHYDDSVSIEIMPIRSPGIDEILVHHACMEHGTGYSQQNLNIFSISKGKLKIELDTEEVVISMYTKPNGIDVEELQRSSFVAIPVSQSHMRIIEETQSDLVNEKLTVQRRQFRWNATKDHYLPTKFVPVVAEPN